MEAIWYVLYIVALFMFFITLVLGVVSKKRILKIFRKFSVFTTICKVSVKEFALIMLANAGVTDIELAEVNGSQTNCYNSKYKALKFSKNVMESNTIATLGLCAHEVGHAIQDKEKITMYRIREKLSPIVNLLFKLFIPLLMIGSVFAFYFNFKTIGLWILWLSIVPYIVSFIFYFAMLFVEHKSSLKAYHLISNFDFLTTEECMAIKSSFSLSKWIYISELSINMLWFINLMSYSRLFEVK